MLYSVFAIMASQLTLVPSSLLPVQRVAAQIALLL
jgi:hypothetical protein